MANTTNFGWETPDDTDLVKDGAAAMRTLGNSIDASFVDLKGGTTGQILSKNSNTDLDFTWIANDQGDITAVTAGTGLTGGGTAGAVTLTNDMATTITASGDIVVGTGSGTYDNLPIGTTGQVLTADTTVSPYKVKWASTSTSFIGCKITKSTDTTISSASNTLLTWDSESFDTDAYHDNVTNNSRITIPTGKGGKYLFKCVLACENQVANSILMRLYKNGNVMSVETNFKPANNYVSGRIEQIWDLAAGDYIQMYFYQDTGSNMTIKGGNYESYWSAIYLGA